MEKGIEEGNRLIAELNNLGYSVLSDGSVLGKRGARLLLHAGTSGYMQLNAWKGVKYKTFLVHRLVASALAFGYL